MTDFPKKLEHKLAIRHQENAFRTLSLKAGLVDFSSNDYLGFSREEDIAEMAKKVLIEEKSALNGATGSRLLSGNYKLYDQLEWSLSEFHNAGAALVFNSGYDANLGFFSSVPQRGDVIFYDELCHASIRDGIRLGNAKSFKFKHNDLDDLSSLTQRFQSDVKSEIYVVTESVFSMDGDSPNLLQMAAFCERNNLRLVMDEAHAVGVFQKGLVNELGLEKTVFARIITFGKALGVHGAAILGSSRLRDFLINFCRSFIYTTGLPPHAIANILSAYTFLKSEQGVKSALSLQKNIDYFKVKMTEKRLVKYFVPSDSAIQACKIEGNDKVKLLSNQLEDKGYDVRPILSPTVPKGQERLRFCLHSYNSKKDIDAILEEIKNVMVP